MAKNKNLSTILGALILVGVAVLIFSNKHVANIGTKNSQLKSTKENVEQAKLPENFPPSLPVEPQAKITQNFSVKTPSGNSQGTRVFETSNTLENSFKLYKEYFLKSGWTSTANVDKETVKIFSATKSKQQAQVTVSQDAATKVKTVEITITSSAK